MASHPGEQQGDEVLREALRTRGQRYTEQRAAVHRFLADTHSHPTADDVFLAVREEVPGISLATVYKSLETLVGCGLATKLTYGDGSARYDGQTEPHQHARCLGCGRVFDLEGAPGPVKLDPEPPVPEGFEVTGYRFEMVGTCRSCRD